MRWRPDVEAEIAQQACPARALVWCLSRRWQGDTAEMSSSPTPKATMRLMSLTSADLRLCHASGPDAALPGTLKLPPKVFSRMLMLALVCKVITLRLVTVQNLSFSPS